MKILLFLVAFLPALALADELRAPGGPGVTVVLSDTKCSSEKVLSLLFPASRELYQDGYLIMPDRTVKFCWRVAPDGQNVWITDEEEDSGELPLIRLAPRPTT